MEIKLFGITKNFIADLIANTILFFVGNKVKDISLTEKDIMKFYYEINLYLKKYNVFSVVDQETFLKFIKGVLDETEVIFEEQKKNDPEFVNKLLKKHAWLWNIYATINDFFDANDIATLMNSDMSKKIQESLNKKMIEDEELLNYKVHRDVDESIKEYEKKEMKETFVDKAVLTETKEGGSLGGQLRIKAPWIED